MACEDYPCCGHEWGDCEGLLYGSDESIKNDPHLLCDHEMGDCALEEEWGDGLEEDEDDDQDDDDDEDEEDGWTGTVPGTFPAGTRDPLAGIDPTLPKGTYWRDRTTA